MTLTPSGKRKMILDVDTGILVALLGEQAAAHVDPAVRHAGMVQVLGDDRRRNQLAVGDDLVVAQLGLLGTVDRLGGHTLQFVEERVDPFELPVAVPQVVDDLRMVAAQRGHLAERRLAVPLLHAGKDPLQGVRRLAHGRDDDEEVLLVVDDLAQVSHAVGVAHRGASEFVDFHIFAVNPTNFSSGCGAAARAAARRPLFFRVRPTF